MIRPSIPWIIFMIDWPTTFSEFVKVGTSAFVESESKQSTPSSPRAAIRCKSAGSPTGVKSNLKSPVQTIFSLRCVDNNSQRFWDRVSCSKESCFKIFKGQLSVVVIS